MGDIRFNKRYDAVRRAKDPLAAIRSLSDPGLVEALAGAAQDTEPYLANTLATELANRVRRQAAIIDAAGEGLSAIDRDGHIVFLNPAAVRMLGRSMGDVRGRSIHDVVHAGTPHPAGEACPLSRAFLAGVRGVWHDDRFMRPDGRLPVSWCGAPLVRDEEVEGAVIVFQDITERVRADAERSERERCVTEQQRALALLAKSTPARAGDVDAFVALLIETSARVLAIERVSVWWFADGPRRIRCHDLWEASKVRHSAGLEIAAAEHPEYFAALEQERVLAADDAWTDVRTQAFGATYLGPLGITSMLDVPVWLQGEFVGIICHEHVGPKRVWRADEQTFAAATADLLAATFEAHERRAAVEDASRNREFLGTVIDALPQLVYVKDREGRFTLANAAVASVYGSTTHDLVAKTEAELDPRARETEAILRADRRVMETGQPLLIPEEAITSASTGETRWFQTTRVPLLDADGRARHVLGVATDITERRLLEGDLQQLFAASASLMAVSTFDGLLDRLNPAWEALTGQPLGEILGRSFVGLLHADDQAGAAVAMERARTAQFPVACVGRIASGDAAPMALAWSVSTSIDRRRLFIVGTPIPAEPSPQEGGA